MMTSEKMTGQDGELKPEIVERAKELIRSIAELCKEEEPAVVLFVLEAAMTAHIGLYAPPLADMFRDMMKAYKEKATIFIGLYEALKHGDLGLLKVLKNGDNLEDLLRMMDDEASQRSNS